MNLSELGFESDIVLSDNLPERILWGVAPTGETHLGYLIYFYLLQLLSARGCTPLILLANYHAYLDSQKSSWEELDGRTKHYINTFKNAGFNNVIQTRDFYTKSDYVENMFKLSSYLHVASVLNAADTTLKANPNSASVADLIYVATQILDVVYLSVDAVVCGLDEAPIYRFGLPIIKDEYSWHCHFIYGPVCPGLRAPEMHASDLPSNKILIADDENIVQSKVAKHIVESYKAGYQPPLASFCLQTLLPLAQRYEAASDLKAYLDASNDDAITQLLGTEIIGILRDWNPPNE